MSSTLTSKKRPLGWRVLFAGFLLLAVRGWGNVLITINDADAYLALSSAPPIWLHIVFNAVGGMIAMVVIVGLLLRRRWLPIIITPLTILVGVGDVIWILLFSNTTYDRQNVPFLIVIWLGIIAIVTMLSRRQSFLRYFLATHKES